MIISFRTGADWSGLLCLPRRVWILRIVTLLCHFVWATARQNQQHDLCTQRRLRSAWASTQSDQSLPCAPRIAKDPRLLHVDSEGSDQTGQMPRLICIFAGRMSFCWFCHVVAHVISCHGFDSFVVTMADGSDKKKGNIRIFNGADWKFRRASWCQAVTRVMEFFFCTEEPLWLLFLAYSSFGNCI